MEVKRIAKNLTRICGQFFRPGLNHVEPHRVDHLLRDRGFRAEIESGRMEIIGAKVTLPGKSKEAIKIEETGPVPGSDMRAKDMVALIEQTFDPETLNHFEEVDQRATVQRAIADQREKIKPPPLEEKGEKETDEAITEGLANKTGG